MSESKNVLAERWAADNGYDLLHSEYRLQSQGPFIGTALSTRQPVFYVKVRDPAGIVRSGWIRFGRRFWGLLSDKTEVKWEK
jgi:hypothetical protein